MALVDVRPYLPEAIFDLRYLTDNNVLGRPLHDDPRALIEERLVDPLVLATSHLLAASLRPKFWDLGRTVDVQNQLLSVNSDSRYVLAADKSNHVKGLAVDLTLTLLDGTEIEMGSDFDEFSEKAWPASEVVTEAERNNRVKLATFMERVGFKQLETEWWHFDFVGLPQLT